MPQDDNANTNYNALEEGIYKVFECMKTGARIKASEFASRLNLTLAANGKYRAIKFSYEALYMTLIFAKIKGIKSQSKLERHLKSNRDDRRKLGLEDTPDQRTISRFKGRILGDEERAAINFIAARARAIAGKFGILFDEEPPKPQKTKSERNFYKKKREMSREVSAIVKKRLSAGISLNIGDRSKYGKGDYLNLMMHMCMHGDFANNGSETMKVQNEHSPDGDTLHYHLKKYPDIHAIRKMFRVVFEMVWEMARKSGRFTRPVDVAIDYTDWLFYGDPGAAMVVGCKPEKGTDRCYRFATIEIVEKEERFTLLAIPVGPFEDKQRILQKLIDYAKERVKINRLYADRGFYDSKSIDLFKRNGIKFLMPCIANERMQKIMGFVDPPKVIKDYEMAGSKFNVVVVKDEKGIKRSFATNIDFDENEAGLAKHLFSLYGKRWGIETGYRVLKHSYWMKTTSKNYLVRLFYFLFSVVLYNMWILADILVCIGLVVRLGGKHAITSKLFGTIMIVAACE